MSDVDIARLDTRLTAVEDTLQKHLESCTLRGDKVDLLLHQIDKRLETDQAVRDARSEDHAKKLTSIRLMFAGTSILLGLPAAAITIQRIMQAMGG